ncbi:hypothetical protein [Commensalibacter sp. Nvir]|uniref:hypothetical protein n=1 Tax=Commensalibacter sp. Nvir TaxID=3069817 RepID=UPI0030C88C41
MTSFRKPKTATLHWAYPPFNASLFKPLPYSRYSGVARVFMRSLPSLNLVEPKKQPAISNSAYHAIG